MALQMVTANRLDDGAVVYRRADGTWSERCADGAVAADETAAKAMLNAAEAAEKACLILTPYLIDVAVDEGRPHPLGIRERIRAAGPTAGTGLTAPMGAQ